MKLYEYVVLPSSKYRSRPTPGIYLGKRSYDKRETMLTLDRNNSTTFVIRLLSREEFETLQDTGKNATDQILSNLEMFERNELSEFLVRDEWMQEDQNGKHG